MTLAIGLIAALSGGVFAFMWQIVTLKSSVTVRALDGQAGDAIFEHIESSLTGAVAADSAGNSGIVGAATSLKVRSRAVGLPLNAGDQDWAAGDLQGTEYTYSSGTLSARRWDGHRNRSAAAGNLETISRNIGAFRLRYYDGAEWLESFDSKAQDGLPVAIEVAIWFGPPEAASDLAPTPEPDRNVPVVGAPLDQDGNPLIVDEPPPETPVLPRPSVAPDRLRVIVVPDGPTTAWKESR